MFWIFSQPRHAADINASYSRGEFRAPLLITLRLSAQLAHSSAWDPIRARNAEWGPARPIDRNAITHCSIAVAKPHAPTTALQRARPSATSVPFLRRRQQGKASAAALEENSCIGPLSLEASRLGLNSRLGKCCTKAAAGRHEFLPLKLLLHERLRVRAEWEQQTLLHGANAAPRSKRCSTEQTLRPEWAV